VQHHYRFAVTVLDREQMDATAFEPELRHSILPWLNARQSFKSAWSPKKDHRFAGRGPSLLTRLSDA
jgi:hypothetical protein